MDLERYLSFIITSIFIIVIPGPSILLVINKTLQKSFGHGLVTIGGEAVSHALFIILAFLGLAPLLLASTQVAIVVKWVGVAYLVFMSLRTMLKKDLLTGANPQETRTEGKLKNHAGSFAQGFFVNTSNPKALLFYASFFPPFIDSTNPIIPQLLLLGLTFLGLFVLISFIIAQIARLVSTKSKAKAGGFLKKWIPGGLYLAAGIMLATVEDS